MSSGKKIGILTRGGDCPGLNAVIRSVVKCSIEKGWEIYGIPNGTGGLINLARGKYQREQLKLTKHGYELPGLLHGIDLLQFLSGSILGSVSETKLEQPELEQEILEGYKILGVDALIAITGDESLEMIYDLATPNKWNWIAIPKTINNDVPFTEYSVGFDTAVNTVTKALYNLTFTAASHERVMVVQVMGRDAGHLALHSGIAGGADIILIPEITPKITEKVLEQICLQIAQIRQEGRKFALIVIAEGVRNSQGEKEKYIAAYLAKLMREYSSRFGYFIEQNLGKLQELDTRYSVLGHLQRSGMPSAFDRMMATLFGVQAISLIEQEHYNQLIVWENGIVNSKSFDKVMPIIKWCHQQKQCSNPVDVSGFMVQTARSLGIYVGEPA
jgi:6-phosphofructokinase 1